MQVIGEFNSAMLGVDVWSVVSDGSRQDWATAPEAVQSPGGARRGVLPS